MGKKPDVVEKEIVKTILLTGERIQARANGPGADILNALSKLTNSLVKMRIQRTGEPVKTSRGRTEAEIIEHIRQHGLPNSYEEMCG